MITGTAGGGTGVCLASRVCVWELYALTCINNIARPTPTSYTAFILYVEPLKSDPRGRTDRGRNFKVPNNRRRAKTLLQEAQHLHILVENMRIK